jgi:hypothetical protein
MSVVVIESVLSSRNRGKNEGKMKGEKMKTTLEKTKQQQYPVATATTNVYKSYAFCFLVVNCD